MFFVAVMLALTAAAFYFINRPRFVHYDDFGIDIPVSYSIHGIDVSRYQKNIDWDDVSSMQVNWVKINFSFIKATEGCDDVDAKFKTNWRAAKEAGIARGAYHFFNPYSSSAAQAKNFTSKVKLQQGDLPPVLDVEQAGVLSKDLLQQRVAEWLVTVERYYKVRPIIYTGADFYTKYLAGKFDDYPLWVAHYLAKDKPRVNRKWNFWQHNEAGHVSGIDAYVDFNVFNGDSIAFQNLLLK